MCLPLPAQKLPSLARIIIRLHHFQSAGETELTGKRKASRTFLISALFLMRKKITKKNRNEKAEEREKCCSVDRVMTGAFIFYKKKVL